MFRELKEGNKIMSMGKHHADVNQIQIGLLKMKK